MSEYGLTRVPERFRYDYGGMCWWCGDIADSREHKWKQSEVVNLFGRGDYGKSVLWIHDDKVEFLRGPKAAGFMFSRSLCTTCNGARSQPFDRAYELLSNYLIANHANLMEQQYIDLADVYGVEVDEQLPNLARYYGKHIGCRVADDAGRVPDDLKSFLDGDADNAYSVFSELGVRELLRSVVDGEGELVIGLSLRESVADRSDSPHVGLTSFKSGLGVGAIEFLYDVNLDPSRVNTGNGILDSRIQPLWSHDEDLYNHRFVRL